MRACGNLGKVARFRTRSLLAVPCLGRATSFGIDFWPQEAIESALGADLADAIPELLRLADLEVRIPRFEILGLECLADRDGKSVDAVLARELMDLVSAHSECLATAIPGFTAALRWPQWAARHA
jgi:hypothetical protein